MSRYLGDAPESLQHILRKMLAKDPERRHGSMRGVQTDLEQLLEDSGRTAIASDLNKSWLVLLAAIPIILLLLTALALYEPNLFSGEDSSVSVPRGYIDSLAVLPLENLSGDPEQDYFVDGMTAALITELGKISALRVISRQSVIQLAGTTKSLPEIARELEVDAIVEGTVSLAGDRVGIGARLIQAEPERQVWSDSYERNLQDILALQSEVAEAIAEEIQLRLTPGERKSLADKGRVHPEALKAYLRARHHVYGLAGEGVERAIEYAKEAIRLDPSYAPAYAALSEAYYQQSFWSAPSEVIPKAREAAVTALRLDETVAEAHVSLGNILMMYDWDWAGAEKEFRRAIQENPSLASAHEAYAWHSLLSGRPREALQRADRALDLDPLSLSLKALQAASYLRLDLYDQAIERCQEGLQIDPNARFLLLWQGYAYLGKGRYEEALETFGKLSELSPDGALGPLGYAYAVSGDTMKAREILEKIENPVEKASVYIGLNSRDQAIELLEKAYRERVHLAFINVFPTWDPLRSDPRFQDLVQRIGLEP